LGHDNTKGWNANRKATILFVGATVQLSPQQNNAIETIQLKLKSPRDATRGLEWFEYTVGVGLIISVCYP
jgi:hypothetical protein